MGKYKFSGHETFPLRFGWLPKGLRALNKDSDIFFNKNEAMVELGVGKNMVRAIRHWCSALELARVDGRKDLGEVEPLGENLFLEPDPWDPYLEDPGTLWLLHWFLANRKEQASTWHLAFTEWNKEVFTKEQLVDWLHGINEDMDTSRATRNSINRDVNVFLRTYVPSEPTAHRPLEDTFDSPFVELGLIRKEEDDLYKFMKGKKKSLPQEIFTFALIDFWEGLQEEQEEESKSATLSFERVLYMAGSPGGAFQLSEDTLAARLEKLPDEIGIEFDETSGLRNLLLTNNELPNKIDILQDYYNRTEAEVAA